MTDQRPKPDSFGFDADFSDLSTVKPATRAAVAKAPKKPSPKPKAVKPRSKPAPKTPAILTERAEMADKLAKSMGFKSREQKPIMLKKRRRTHHDEPVDQLSIRGPVRVLNDFITFCETEHLSYWEALESLLASKSSST